MNTGVRSTGIVYALALMLSTVTHTRAESEPMNLTSKIIMGTALSITGLVAAKILYDEYIFIPLHEDIIATGKILHTKFTQDHSSLSLLLSDPQELDTQIKIFMNQQAEELEAQIPGWYKPFDEDDEEKTYEDLHDAARWYRRCPYAGYVTILDECIYRLSSQHKRIVQGEQRLHKEWTEQTMSPVRYETLHADYKELNTQITHTIAELNRLSTNIKATSAYIIERNTSNLLPQISAQPLMLFGVGVAAMMAFAHFFPGDAPATS